MDQEQLELLILKHVTTESNAMIAAETMRVQPDWFVHKLEADETSFTRMLYQLSQEYYRESNGQLLSQFNLGEKLVKHDKSATVKRKMLNLFSEVESQDYNPNDLHLLLATFKERAMIRRYGEMTGKAHEILAEKGLAAARDHFRKQLDEMDEMEQEWFTDTAEVNIADSVDYFESEVSRRRLMGEDEGIMCGMSEIDNVTQGWRPGQYIVVVARSSGGKSIVLMNWGAHAHLKGKNVLYFSLEMPVWQCYLRHLSWLCCPAPDETNSLTHKNLKGLKFDDAEKEEIIEKLRGVAGGAYFIYSDITADPTAEAIERKLRMVTREHGKPDLIVVDYVGKMTSKNAARGSKIWERSAEAGIELDRLAKKYQISLITAAQLSKSSITEHRKQKKEGKSSIVDMDQDMVSGSHSLVSDASYIFGFDSIREEQRMVFFSIKMREGGWLVPFPCQVRPEYNYVEQADAEGILTFRSANGLYTGHASPDRTTAAEESQYAPTPYCEEKDSGEIEVGAPGGKRIFAPDDLTFDAPVDWGVE